MQPFGMVVRFVLKPGTGAAFDALMRETMAGIRSGEPDTLAYVVHSVEDEPDVRIFYELYRSDAGLTAHEQQATTRFFLDHRDEYVASYSVERLRPVVGTGVSALDEATSM